MNVQFSPRKLAVRAKKTLYSVAAVVGLAHCGIDAHLGGDGRMRRIVKFAISRLALTPRARQAPRPAD